MIENVDRRVLAGFRCVDAMEEDSYHLVQRRLIFFRNLRAGHQLELDVGELIYKFRRIVILQV